MKEKQTIFLDKKVCLICTHLVGELGRKTKTCTAKKGNTRCPAQFFQLEVGVDTEQAIQDFYLALQDGNIESILVALTAAQSNPKISSAVIRDLQDRLFEGPTEDAEELNTEVSAQMLADAENYPTNVENSEDEEDEDEDEDVDA